MLTWRTACVAALLSTAAYSAAHAAPETYKADTGHASVRACWSHFGVSDQCVYFREPDATLVYDDADPTKSTLTVTFDLKKLETLVPVFNGHLTSGDWFDVAKYPTATFKSTKIEKTSDKTGKVTGDLTVKGATKPVTMDVKLNFAGVHPYPKNGPSLGFSAVGKLKRSDFNLGNFAPAVSDDIALQIDIEFNKKS